MTAVSQEPATTPAAGSDDEPKRGGAPTRTYIVLEEFELEGDDAGHLAYQVVSRVEARNGQNALRKAFKEIRETRENFDAATLAVIPENQWKPTPVRAERREQITVAVGD